MNFISQEEKLILRYSSSILMTELPTSNMRPTRLLSMKKVLGCDTFGATLFQYRGATEEN
jgi:hypothetical protein